MLYLELLKAREKWTLAMLQNYKERMTKKELLTEKGQSSVLMLAGNSELKIKGFKKWIRGKILNDESMNTCNHYKQKKYTQNTYQIHILS